MTTIALPAGVVPNSFSMRLLTVQRAHASPFGGSEQVVDMLNDRWHISLTLPNRLTTEAAAIEAFIASMRGMTNTVNLYHWVRQAPRGTMRGSPTISILGTAGGDNITVQTTAGATLLAGDMIGCGGLLLQVRVDCTANGSGVLGVPLVNRLRTTLSVSASVTWDKPTAPFRLVGTPSQQYLPGYGDGVALDFVEAVP